MAFEFKFPDVGEGITEGELLSWKVKEGDVVAEDQTLAEVETDKAVVEIPSPRAGRIAKLHVEEGETIEVGQVLVTIEEGVTAAATAAAGDACSGARRDGCRASLRRPPPRPYQPPRRCRPRRRSTPARSWVSWRRPLRTSEPAAAASVGRRRRRRRGERVETPRCSPCPPSASWPRSWVWTSTGCAAPVRADAILRQDVEDWAEAGAYGRETVTRAVDRQGGRRHRRGLDGRLPGARRARRRSSGWRSAASVARWPGAWPTRWPIRPR